MNILWARKSFIFIYIIYIRIVRFYKSTKFTTSVTFDNFLLWRLSSSPFDLSWPNYPRHHPSCQPHITYFTYFTHFFFFQKFPPIYPSFCVQWYVVFSRKKNGNLVPHFFTIVNLFLLGAYFLYHSFYFTFDFFYAYIQEMFFNSTYKVLYGLFFIWAMESNNILSKSHQ